MIKQILTSLFITLGVLVSMQLSAPLAYAGLFDEPKKQACAGTQVSGVEPDCGKDASGKVDDLIRNIVNILSFIIGIIAVIMIIVSGLRFITSGGDPNSVSSARNGVIYAVIGLVLVGMAQFIVRFVLSRTSG